VKEVEVAEAQEKLKNDNLDAVKEAITLEPKEETHPERREDMRTCGNHHVLEMTLLFFGLYYLKGVADVLIMAERDKESFTKLFLSALTVHMRTL